MDTRSIYALLASGFPVYAEGGSGQGKTEFMLFLREKLADPRLAVVWNVGALEDKVLFGMTYISPHLIDEQTGKPIEVPFTDFALTQAAQTYAALLPQASKDDYGNPVINGKWVKVAILGDEIRHGRPPVKRAIQAALTSGVASPPSPNENTKVISGAEWAGYRIGHPIVFFTGNPMEQSTLAEPLGPALNTRLIRVTWKYDYVDFVRFVYHVLWRQQVEQARKETFKDAHAEHQYKPLTDREYIDRLKILMQKVDAEKQAHLKVQLAMAIDMGERALAEGRSLDWSVEALPDPQKVREYHHIFSTMLIQYFEGGDYEKDLRALSIPKEVEEDNPLPNNRTITMAIGAAATLAALYDNPAHPDVREAIIGAVGKQIGTRIASIIANSSVLSLREVSDYLSGKSDLPQEKLKSISEHADLIYGTVTILLEESARQLRNLLAEDKVATGVNPLKEPIARRTQLDGHAFYYGAHPRRVLFGSQKAVDILNRLFMALDILGKSGANSAILAKALAYLPMDFVDQLKRAASFITRNKNLIVSLAEKNKLAYALPWLITLDNARLQWDLRNFARFFFRDTPTGRRSLSITGVENMELLSSLSVGWFNFIPLAARYMPLIVQLLSLGKHDNQTKEAAEAITKLFDAGYVFKVSDRLYGNEFSGEAREEEQEPRSMIRVLSDIYHHLVAITQGEKLSDKNEDQDKLKELADSFVVDFGFRLFAFLDIFVPLLDNDKQDTLLKFLTGSREDRLQIVRELITNYEPRMMVFDPKQLMESNPQADEKVEQELVESLKKFTEGVKTLVRSSNPSTILEFENTLHKVDKNDNGLKHGVLYYAQPLIAEMKKYQCWMPDEDNNINNQAQQNTKSRIEFTATPSRTKLSNLEERLGVASLLLYAGVNVFLVGEFGIGKTSWALTVGDHLMRNISPKEYERLKELGLSNVIFIPTPALSPTELSGITYPYYDPRQKRLVITATQPFYFRNIQRIREIAPEIPVIVFFEEITGADRLTQQGLPGAMQKGITYLAAGNPTEGDPLFADQRDSMVFSDLANPLPEVIRRRFTTLPVSPSSIDSRPMELGLTMAHFLQKNSSAPFVPGSGFKYNMEWPLPPLPDKRALAMHILFWSKVITEFTSQAPQKLTSMSGLRDSDLLPFDSPATRSNLARALAALSASSEPYNSPANIALVVYGTIGTAAGQDFIKFIHEHKHIEQLPKLKEMFYDVFIDSDVQLLEREKNPYFFRFQQSLGDLLTERDEQPRRSRRRTRGLGEF